MTKKVEKTFTKITLENIKIEKILSHGSIHVAIWTKEDAVQKIVRISYQLLTFYLKMALNPVRNCLQEQLNRKKVELIKFAQLGEDNKLITLEEDLCSLFNSTRNRPAEKELQKIL